MSQAPEAFDYIVVGAGSAGCVVAGELSAQREQQVLLLEVGDRAEEHPETLAADGYKHAFANDALLLDRFSVPQLRCGGHRLYLGSGRGLGGSGSINGMVYTRGDVRDYERWPVGWRYADLAPAFAQLEARLRVRPRAPTAFTEAFVEAAEQVGFRRSIDLNDGQLGGVIGYETMNYEGEQRRSSYVAFVKEAAGPNLQVWPRARTRRVVFRGRRAVGVEVEVEGQVRLIRARREVVLCAGALETPKLLMLSGIGPASLLQRFAIPLVHALPQVGENLHDHPNVAMFYLGSRPVDAFYPQLYGFHRANPGSDLTPGQSDTCYVMYPARSSFREAAMRMLPAKLPRLLYGETSKRWVRAAVASATGGSAAQDFIARVWGCVVILGKPKSRGRLTLASRDAAVQARIDPAYFEHPEDLQTLVRGVKLARALASAAPLARWGNRPLLPLPWWRSDGQLTAFVRANVMTTFHYAGTCRMGDDDAAVVDAQLRVRGVEGLRVADASVAPETPVSAMNAPSMVIGLRAAQMMVRAMETEAVSSAV